MRIIEYIPNQTVMYAKSVFKILHLKRRIGYLLSYLRLNGLDDRLNLVEIKLFADNEKINS